ncbi:RepA [Sewage-associated gemycircularvirus 9]|uniref:RepA n=1 Tax=sewage derived gemycircularvirus 5 TaxID=1985411 RepID=A0A0A7CL72_9VIRU|nr:RepA [Sewage-associated gemycircularvirus 9]AIF34841.1 RepA [Sewage-associated gemycircularvirus 9]
MPFNLHCRYALLTYAQCGDLSPTAVGEFFDNLGYKSVIGRENHADGGVHLHCFVDFGRKRRFRRARVFDIENRHPNVEPSRGTPEKGWDYAVKDGDICYQSLDRPRESSPSGGSNGGTRDKWASITGASDREAFWDLVHELDPKSAACCFTQLQKYCDWKFAPRTPEYESPGGLEFIGGGLDGRDDWLLQSGIGGREAFVGELVCRISRLALPPLRCGGILRLQGSDLYSGMGADLGRQMYVNLCIRGIPHRKDTMGPKPRAPYLLCRTGIR